jgi:parallel beta-helix repeat protein
MLALPALAAGGTVYVDPVLGDDGWDGRCRMWTGGLCGPKQTIQAGIDAAEADEEVVLAPGVYTGAGNKDLTFGLDPITLRSEDDDPYTCIIDCQHDGRGATLYDGREVTMRGLTITNGVAPDGGGIYASRSSITLINCRLVGNAAVQTPQGYGGGLQIEFQSQFNLTNCDVAGNFATGCGGGISAFYSYSTDRGWLNIVGCTIHDNVAQSGGGGIYIDSYYIDIYDSIISNNNAASGGGGILLIAWAGGEMGDCLMYGNTAGQNGGGLYLDDGSEHLINCTLSGNTAGGYGGAIGLVGWTDATLRQCILWDNRAAQDAEIGFGPFGDPHIDEFTYTDIAGGWAGLGNIDENPLFVSPGDGDFRLAAGSPCRDSGDPAYVPPVGAADLDARLRVWDGDGDGTARVDMGAYEFAAHWRGDVNCDDLINAFDIEPFVLALTSPTTYAASYPECNLMTADANGDGQLNAFDIDPFVLLLVGG